MKTKIYSAPCAEVRKTSIRASILAGSAATNQSAHGNDMDIIQTPARQRVVGEGLD